MFLPESYTGCDPNPVWVWFCVCVQVFFVWEKGNWLTIPCHQLTGGPVVWTAMSALQAVSLLVEGAAMLAFQAGGDMVEIV